MRTIRRIKINGRLVAAVNRLDIEWDRLSHFTGSQEEITPLNYSGDGRTVCFTFAVCHRVGRDPIFAFLFLWQKLN